MNNLKPYAVGAWMWVVFAVVSTGCTGCAARIGLDLSPKQPDTTGIMRVIGRYALASACPIGPRTALTNAHVVDPRPFDKDAPLTPVQFQHGLRTGILMPKSVSTYRDLAYLELEEREPDLAMFYQISSAAPQPGDTLYLTGFNWESKRDAFDNKLFTVKVLRIVANHIVFEPSGEPGTSGSCILNEAGDVVGINAFGKVVGTMGMQEVGAGLLIIKGLE